MPALIVPAENPSEFSRSPSLCPNLFRCDVPWRGLSAALRVRCCLGMWSVEMIGIMGRLVWVPMLHYHKDSWHPCCFPVESIFLFLVLGLQNCISVALKCFGSVLVWVPMLNSVKVCHCWGKMSEIEKLMKDEKVWCKMMATSWRLMPGEMELWKHLSCAGGGVLTSWSIRLIRVRAPHVAENLGNIIHCISKVAKYVRHPTPSEIQPFCSIMVGVLAFLLLK